MKRREKIQDDMAPPNLETDAACRSLATSCLVPAREKASRLVGNHINAASVFQVAVMSIFDY